MDESVGRQALELYVSLIVAKLIECNCITKSDLEDFVARASSTWGKLYRSPNGAILEQLGSLVSDTLAYIDAIPSHGDHSVPDGSRQADEPAVRE